MSRRAWGRGARGASALLALSLPLGACAASGTPADPTARRAPLGLPPGWGRIRPLLEAGHVRAAAHDAAGLRALAPEVNAEGLALLRANTPNDVARPDLARYLEGRALFGEALLAFARAAESGSDAGLPDLFTRLADAWYAWMAALRGLPSEHTL